MVTFFFCFTNLDHLSMNRIFQAIGTSNLFTFVFLSNENMFAFEIRENMNAIDCVKYVAIEVVKLDE